jgi:hypothetical protein
MMLTGVECSMVFQANRIFVAPASKKNRPLSRGDAQQAQRRRACAADLAMANAEVAELLAHEIPEYRGWRGGGYGCGSTAEQTQPRTSAASSARRTFAPLPCNPSKEEQVQILVQQAIRAAFDDVDSSLELTDFLATPEAAPLTEPPKSRCESTSPCKGSVDATAGSVGSAAVAAGVAAWQHGGLLAVQEGELAQAAQPQPGLTPSSAPAVDKRPQAAKSVAKEKTASLQAAAAPNTVGVASAGACVDGSARRQASRGEAACPLARAAAALPAWTAMQQHRPEVAAALELHKKMGIALALPPADERRPLWLGAIAITATQKGIAAVKGACPSHGIRVKVVQWRWFDPALGGGATVAIEATEK